MIYDPFDLAQDMFTIDDLSGTSFDGLTILSYLHTMLRRRLFLRNAAG